MVSFSSNDSSSNTEYHTISVEQVNDFSSSATLVEPVSLPTYNNSFENCICFGSESWLSNSYLTNSNKVVSLQLKTEELSIYEFLPDLLRLQLSYLQFASTEDYLVTS